MIKAKDKTEKKVEQKKVDQYPSNPNDHFKLAEGYLLNDLNKAELAFKNFIYSTFNNTIISIADESGNVVSWSSAGAKGFKGSRKSTPYAAQVAADDAGAKAYEQGLRTLTVQVKGPGSGRETALRSLQSRGFKILSIKDTTPMPHNGARPPKRRRV